MLRLLDVADFLAAYYYSSLLLAKSLPRKYAR